MLAFNQIIQTLLTSNRTEKGIEKAIQELIKVKMTAEEAEAHINPSKTQEQISQEAREARAAAMLEGDV